MNLKRYVIIGIAVLLFCQSTQALSDMYKIENAAEKIKNPADKMHNPSSTVNNPAANIYNPAGRIADPNVTSPPTQTIPEPAVTNTAPATEQPLPKPKPKPAIPQKKYNYKTVAGYMVAIKKAFIKDNYIELLSLTEDALRRISTDTLKASDKTKLKLEKYKLLGYTLLEADTSQ